MLWLNANMVVAAGAGAFLGQFMRCRTGGGSLFSDWKRGLVVGALIGLLNGMPFLK